MLHWHMISYEATFFVSGLWEVLLTTTYSVLAYLVTEISHINERHKTGHQPLALLEGPCPFQEYKFMPAGSANNPRCCISIRVLAVGMVKSGETTTCAHLFAKHVS